MLMTTGTESGPAIASDADEVVPASVADIAAERGTAAFDTAPLAESTLQRAVGLAPGDPDVANYLEQHHAIQREIQAATGARRAR